jgi:hypothetical protein
MKSLKMRDLAIGRLGGGINAGIDVSRANKVFIRDVLVTGFFAGIYGSRLCTTRPVSPFTLIVAASFRTTTTSSRTATRSTGVFAIAF